MTNITLNINRKVAVKLTRRGIEMYRQYRRDFSTRHNCKLRLALPKKQKNGMREFQLWYLMQIFGPYISAGVTNVPFAEIHFDSQAQY